MILLFLLLGAMAGGVHFAAIAKDAELLTRGGSALAAIGLRLGRLALTIMVLLLASLRGWPVLLAAVAGLMIARAVVQRRLKRSA